MARYETHLTRIMSELSEKFDRLQTARLRNVL
jgi:hypothetical protein